MGMKRAREVLSATAEVATSEAPPNDPALPKHPPQPVPPPGRLLPHLGHCCRYRHYRRHPRRGGRRRRDGYRRQRPRCRGSQRRQHHRCGCCRRGEGWQRHAPPAAPLRPQGAGAARQGEVAPKSTPRSRLFLHGPSDPCASAVHCFTACARIAYGSAEPAVDARRDDPRGSGILHVSLFFYINHGTRSTGSSAHEAQSNSP